MGANTEQTVHKGIGETSSLPSALRVASSGKIDVRLLDTLSMGVIKDCSPEVEEVVSKLKAKESALVVFDKGQLFQFLTPVGWPDPDPVSVKAATIKKDHVGLVEVISIVDSKDTTVSSGADLKGLPKVLVKSYAVAVPKL